jgi:hypothetical protein
MVDVIIGTIHIIFSFLISIYSLWRRPSYDFLYLLYFLLLNISWILMKNECVVSYLIKTLEDDSYKLGENLEVEDYQSVLGSKGASAFLNFILFMYAFNVMFVLLKGQLPAKVKMFVLASLVSYLVYIFSLRSQLSLDAKDIIGQFHLLISFVTLLKLPFH